MDRECVSRQRWLNTLLDHLNTLTEVNTAAHISLNNMLQHTAIQTLVLIGKLSEGHRAEKAKCEDH